MYTSYITIALATLLGAATPGLTAPSQASDKVQAGRIVARGPAHFGPLSEELLKGIAGSTAAQSGLFGGVSAVFVKDNLQRGTPAERSTGAFPFWTRLLIQIGKLEASSLLVI